MLTDKKLGEHLTPKRLDEMHIPNDQVRLAYKRMLEEGFQLYWKGGGTAASLGLTLIDPDGRVVLQAGSLSELGGVMEYLVKA